MTHTCVSKLTIIASDNGLSPRRRQAIIWTSAGILLIRPLGTNFSENLIEIIPFSLKQMCLKVSSAKWRPCCLGLNVLILMLVYLFLGSKRDPWPLIYFHLIVSFMLGVWLYDMKRYVFNKHMGWLVTKFVTSHLELSYVRNVLIMNSAFKANYRMSFMFRCLILCLV